MHDDGKSALHPSCARLVALACVVGRRFSGTKQLPGAVTKAKTPSPLALVGMGVLETAFEIPHGVASPAFSGLFKRWERERRLREEPLESPHSVSPKVDGLEPSS